MFTVNVVTYGSEGAVEIVKSFPLYQIIEARIAMVKYYRATGHHAWLVRTTV